MAKKSQRCVTKCKRGKGGSWCRTAAGNPKRCKPSKSAGGKKKARRKGKRSFTKFSCYGYPASTRKYTSKVSCKKRVKVPGHSSCKRGSVTSGGKCRPAHTTDVRTYYRCPPKKGVRHGSARPRRLCIKGTKTVR